MQPTILIVDDEQMLLELFQEVLSADYEVMATKSIDDAVEVLQAQHVDALVTDLNCGEDGNGLDLLRWVQQCKPELMPATLVLSGAYAPDLEDFDVPVISKPIDLTSLKQTLARLFGEHERASR